MLAVEGLRAGYGPAEVLHGVDLEVGEREIVALVGSNGAGKTTLLRTLSGMIAARGGSVRFRDRELTGLDPEQILAAGIAHVPEGRRLFAGLTVRENLRAGALQRGSGDLDAVLDLFPRLAQRLDQVAGSMSGGEQQMCAIARGLMSEPDLLMVDELSLGLAPNLVDQIVERLAAVAERGTAVLLVEQDADAALRASARGYVLELGEIRTSGDAGELLRDEEIRRAYLGV